MTLKCEYLSWDAFKAHLFWFGERVLDEEEWGQKKKKEFCFYLSPVTQLNNFALSLCPLLSMAASPEDLSLIQHNVVRRLLSSKQVTQPLCASISFVKWNNHGTASL